MIIIIGRILCDPSQAERFAAEARLMVSVTRDEPGRLDYALLAESLAEGRFLAIEREGVAQHKST